MFRFEMTHLSHDADLQIVHADLKWEIDGDVLIEEPVCIDVGMPAFIQSALGDTTPDRWAPPVEWEKAPFFCCGCGDPECRGFSFSVRHTGDMVELTELEERQQDEPRKLGVYTVPAGLYRRTVLEAGQKFLAFVEPLPYKPLLANTVELVAGRLDRLRRLTESAPQADDRA